MAKTAHATKESFRCGWIVASDDDVNFQQILAGLRMPDQLSGHLLAFSGLLPVAA
jgi:hypothetical protein